MSGLAEASVGYCALRTQFAPFGALLLVHGADHFLTGCYAFISGTPCTSVTSQLLQKTGMSPEIANLTDNSLSIFGSMTALGYIRSLPNAFPCFNLPSVKNISTIPENTITTPTNANWLLPKNGGGAIINNRWYTEHALERMAPNTPEVMAELEARTLKRAKAKGYEFGTDEFGKWLVKNKPQPRGIPPSVVEAEIANHGSTNISVYINENGSVITVYPVE